MLLDLYGDGKNSLLFQSLATGFKEAHLQDKVMFEVVPADKVGQKFKDAVKDQYNAKFLDDADIIIRFAVPKDDASGQDDGQEEEVSSPEKPEEEKEETEEKVEVKDGDTEEKKTVKKTETVNEAETTATGAELDKKIIDTVERRLFQKDSPDKVELTKLDDYMDGYDVSFIKVSLKDDVSSSGGE